MTHQVKPARTAEEAFDDGASAADDFVDRVMTWHAGRHDPNDPTPDVSPHEPRCPYSGRLARAWRDGWADYMLNHAPPAPKV